MTYLKVKEIGGGDNDSELLVFPDFDLQESLLEDIEDARVMVCDLYPVVFNWFNTSIKY